ncbi:iron complex transport system substrate-binding protein [Kineococcus radiotolerans]|uniref:Iron complex transport system substrate-binding protein n=1 Tax=Kineococcus radiotolerans TaxID=131568 RepID=A0A7W4TNC3_KINRA|nr:ABC transporter substrate-binding protein [Kineococcus radiotolerans]MBB2902032.1 iron complex transport system substrate-binding protein [Kineococcus radiotolerans]
MPPARSLRLAAAGTLVALTLTACSGTRSAEEPAAAAEPTTVTVQDNHGPQTVPSPARSVVATDNSTFETLDAWDVPLTAAPRALMPATVSYKTDDSVVDLGTHREPDLEAVVAADPDLIVNGGRFAQFRGDLVELAPDAAVVEVDPREGEPLDAELKRSTTLLGEVFGKQTEAEALNDALDASIARAKAAYSPGTTVMGLIVSGGELGYVAPSTGRTIGPVFDVLGLTPALEVPGGSDDHQGDDISVEAIATSNPDLIIVMDRDAATSEAAAPGYVPAAQAIESSEALAGVSAVRTGDVVYLPADTYTNEGIQTYTEFFDALADQLERA